MQRGRLVAGDEKRTKQLTLDQLESQTLLPSNLQPKLLLRRTLRLIPRRISVLGSNPSLERLGQFPSERGSMFGRVILLQEVRKPKERERPERRVSFLEFERQESRDRRCVGFTHVQRSSRNSYDGQSIEFAQKTTVNSLELVHLRVDDVVNLSRVLGSWDGHSEVAWTRPPCKEERGREEREGKDVSSGKVGKRCEFRAQPSSSSRREEKESSPREGRKGRGKVSEEDSPPYESPAILV